MNIRCKSSQILSTGKLCTYLSLKESVDKYMFENYKSHTACTLCMKYNSMIFTDYCSSCTRHLNLSLKLFPDIGESDHISIINKILKLDHTLFTSEQASIIMENIDGIEYTEFYRTFATQIAYKYLHRIADTRFNDITILTDRTIFNNILDTVKNKTVDEVTAIIRGNTGYGPYLYPAEFGDELFNLFSYTNDTTYIDAIAPVILDIWNCKYKNDHFLYYWMEFGENLPPNSSVGIRDNLEKYFYES